MRAILLISCSLTTGAMWKRPSSKRMLCVLLNCQVQYADAGMRITCRCRARACRRVCTPNGGIYAVELSRMSERCAAAC